MPRGSYSTASNEKRALIIESYCNDEDYVEVAARLNVKRGTAYSIIRKYKESGLFTSGKKGGAVRFKVDDEMKDCLQMLLEENNLSTVRRLNDRLRTILPEKPHVSDKTVGRALDGMLYTCNETRNVVCDKNRDVKEERHLYADWYLSEGIQKHIVFVDEAGYNVYTQRRYKRPEDGTRRHRVVGGQRGKNITLMVAMSSRNGIIYHEFIRGSTTTEKYNNFLTSLCGVLGDEEACIIMGSARMRDQASVDLEPHSLRYLPAYSPFLNPMEIAFSKLKSSLKERLEDSHQRVVLYDRAAARQLNITMEEFRARFLIENGEIAVQTITTEDCFRWHQLAMSYLPRCLAREDIDIS